MSRVTVADLIRVLRTLPPDAPVDRRLVRATERIRDHVDDLRWLAESGESPERWAQRLGITEAALAKRLYRAGLHELARPVARVAHRRERERM